MSDIRVGIDRQLGSQGADFGTTLTIYLRNTGDDANNGLTVGTAVATMKRAKELTPRFYEGGLIVWDMTGFSETLDEPFHVPQVFGSAHVSSGEFAFSMYADLADVLSVTVSGVTPHVTHTMPTVAVNETLTVNAHVGQFLVGSGANEVGVIVSNTASDIVVASLASTFTAPVKIQQTSCSLTLGDSSDPLNTAFALYTQSSFRMRGISLRASNANVHAMMVVANYSSRAELCDIDRVLVRGGGEAMLFLSCYMQGKFYLQAPVNAQECFFDSVDFYSSNSEKSQFLASWFDACDVGDGPDDFRPSMRLWRCQVDNAPSIGIDMLNPHYSSIEETDISNSVGDAISLDGGRVKVDGCSGSGNGGYGLSASNGAIVDAMNSPTLSGSSGEVFHGVREGRSWADMMQNNQTLAAPNGWIRDVIDLDTIATFTVTDDGANGAWATAVLGNLPRGYLIFLGACITDAVIMLGANVVTGWGGDISVGTSQLFNATQALDSTRANILPAQSVSAVGLNAVLHPHFSTPSEHGLILDNTAKTMELNLNLKVDDIDISDDSTAVLQGEMRIAYVLLGDDVIFS